MKTYYGSDRVLLEYLSTDILDDVWSNVLHVVGHHHLNFSAITTYVCSRFIPASNNGRKRQPDKAGNSI